jgi:Ca2+-binding RTX toxin-like protein
LAHAQAWLVGQRNSNTGQTSPAIYEFRTLNLRISQIEQIVIRDEDGNFPTPEIDLAASSDSGVSSSDDLTNDDTPKLTGWAAEIGSMVKIYDGATLLGEAVVGTGGIWCLDVTTDLSDGVHNLTVVSANLITSSVLAVTIDTVAPTVTVDIVDPSLSDSDNSSEVTFTFSEEIAGFTEADVTVGAGLSLVTGSLVQDSGNPLLWTARVTAANDFDGTVSISIANSAFTDPAGNSGVGDSDEVDIDTENPEASVVIDAASLDDGDNSTSVTITFTEAVSGFAIGDLTAVGGSLSSLTTLDNISWTVTFTAADDFDGTGSVTVSGAYTDAVGNLGVTGASDEVDIDTENPTVTVTVATEPLTDASPSTTVTFQFSEAIDASSFTIGDIVSDSTKGTLSGFTMVDADTWTVTYTALDGFDGSDTISIAAGSYTDAAGNDGGGGSDTVAIDRFEATAFTANDDTVYISSGTNGATFALSALVGNDVGASGLTFTITGGAATYNSTTQMITLTNSSAGTFTYQLSDGTTTDSASVTVNVLNVTGGTDVINLSGQNYAAAYFDLGNGVDTFTGSTVVGSISQDTILGAAGGDILSGNEGIDTLNGQGGNDTLNGGAGADTFLFNTALNAANNVDTIQDFDASGNATSGDKIHLDDAIFVGLTAVNLASNFQSSATGTFSGTAKLQYNSTTGELWYDSDGAAGGTAAVLFADITLVGGTLDATDFAII